ncbi:hypothetical protein XENTR_v10005403 [Xenopus tropicalis]|uniref:Uncharacterized LOC100498004 n=1 Tax=Xenopus tropicalis TaxID=8364 RepID=A0A6I8SB34_XENTR|nr:uncharacterized protein LOC100498004 [Xenopus tropicalis]KAE8622816.1 hypothetical protein XENTR_v10005403 [Xenopus tropicalis]|eukprot:XP_002938483.1 PREDICTED: uncharacterized protein LOC100498004 [Xenopus tropicalis]
MALIVTKAFYSIFVFVMVLLWDVMAENEPTTALNNVTSTPQVTSVNVSSTDFISSMHSTIDNTNTSSSGSSTGHENTTTFSAFFTSTSSRTENPPSENGSLSTTTIATLLSTINESVTGYTGGTSRLTLNTTYPAQEHSTSYNNTQAVTSFEWTSVNSTNTGQDGIISNLNDSETILTSIFSTILGIVVLAIFAFILRKYRKRRSQYSHQPLNEYPYDSADRYSAPDDTLVISGGLYDGPRIYNPNMTALEEEDSQPDYVPFNSRPGQFRLEFLPGEKEMNPSFNGSTLDTHNSLQRIV